jgi:hypothetical protein
MVEMQKRMLMERRARPTVRRKKTRRKRPRRKRRRSNFLLL